MGKWIAAHVLHRWVGLAGRLPKRVKQESKKTMHPGRGVSKHDESNGTRQSARMPQATGIGASALFKLFLATMAKRTVERLADGMTTRRGPTKEHDTSSPADQLVREVSQGNAGCRNAVDQEDLFALSWAEFVDADGTKGRGDVAGAWQGGWMVGQFSSILGRDVGQQRVAGGEQRRASGRL